MDDLVATLPLVTVGSDESAVKRRRIETLENLEKSMYGASENMGHGPKYSSAHYYYDNMHKL